jgi:hypothetical protein
MGLLLAAVRHNIGLTPAEMLRALRSRRMVIRKERLHHARQLEEGCRRHARRSQGSEQTFID